MEGVDLGFSHRGFLQQGESHTEPGLAFCRCMTLSDYITREKLDPVATMNALQDHGVISDNAENPADVGNHAEAIEFLARNLKPQQPTLF
jgi:hypothetical protein